MRRPDRLFLLLLAVGGTVGWGFGRLGHWLPARAHGMRHPLVVWSIALARVDRARCRCAAVAPGAAFLWLVPLLIAGVLLTFVPPSSVGGVRAASGLILVAVAALWLLPTITTAALRGGDLRPPADRDPGLRLRGNHRCRGNRHAAAAHRADREDASAGSPGPRHGTGRCSPWPSRLACAYMAPAYTDEQPLRRAARAVQEADGPAVWDVGSVEPGIDLGEGAPSGWQPAGAGRHSLCPFRGFSSRSSSAPRDRRSGQRRSRWRADARASAGRLGACPSPSSRTTRDSASPSCCPRASSRRDRICPAYCGSAAGPQPTSRRPRTDCVFRASVRPHRSRAACATFASSSLPWARATDRAGSCRHGCRRPARPGRPRRTGSWRRSPCRLRPSRRYVKIRNRYGIPRNVDDQPFRLRRNRPGRGIRRPRSRARPAGPRPLRRPEGLPHLAAALRQIVAGAAGPAQRGAQRRVDGRSPGQQLQLLRRVPRGLRPRPGVGRDPARSGAIVAERDARRRAAGGSRRT